MRGVYVKKVCLCVSLILSTVAAWCGGATESSTSSDRGKAVAESGRIIPPEEVRVDSYISEIDFGYPHPSGDFGITLLSGHRQVSRLGQDELIVIGLQGERGGMEALPPLNLALVLDTSGSMSGGGKRALALECLRALLARLRDQDVLSVISLAGKPAVLLPSYTNHPLSVPRALPCLSRRRRRRRAQVWLRSP